MTFRDRQEVESFVNHQKNHFDKKKKLNYPRLELAKKWIHDNLNASEWKTLLRSIDSLLVNYTQSIPTSETFEIKHSYRPESDPGVVTVNCSDQSLTHGDDAAYVQAVRVTQEIRKEIDLNHLNWTSYIRTPTTEHYGFFVLSVDKGLDYAGRPSNFERYMFSFPPEVNVSSLLSLVDEFHTTFCSRHQTNGSPNQRLDWSGALLEGGKVVYNDFEDFKMAIPTLFETYGALPNQQWTRNSVHLVYNPDEAHAIQIPSASNVLNELMKFERTHEFSFSNYNSVNSAYTCMRKLNWLSFNDQTESIDSIVNEVFNWQMDGEMYSYISKNKMKLVGEKTDAFFHCSRLKSYVEKANNADSNARLKFKARSQSSKEILLHVLSAMGPSTHGSETLSYLKEYTDIKTNEAFETFSSLPCWDKEAKKELAVLHDRINWQKKYEALFVKESKIKQNIQLLIKEIEPKVRLSQEYKTAIQKRELASTEQQDYSERFDKSGDILSLLERARLVRDLTEAPEEIRQKYKQIFVQHKPPSRLLRFKKEPIEISLTRNAVLRMDLIRAMNEDYERIALDRNKFKVREEKCLQTISKLNKHIQQLEFESEIEFKLHPQSIDVTTQLRHVTGLNAQLSQAQQQLEKHQKLEPIK